MVRHDSLRGGHDRDAKSIRNARHRVDCGINPPSWLRHALNRADHRLPVKIFELYFKLGPAIAIFGCRIAANISLRLEDIEHMRAKPRAWRLHLALAAHLGIANTGQHITQRIVNRHDPLLPTSSISRDQGSDPWSPIPSQRCATSSFCV